MDYSNVCIENRIIIIIIIIFYSNHQEWNNLLNKQLTF
jgi:hypothetical protein